MQGQDSFVRAFEVCQWKNSTPTACLQCKGSYRNIQAFQTGKKSPGETGRQGSTTLWGPRNSWEVAGFCYVNKLSISLENKSCYWHKKQQHLLWSTPNLLYKYEYSHLVKCIKDPYAPRQSACKIRDLLQIKIRSFCKRKWREGREEGAKNIHSGRKNSQKSQWAKLEKKARKDLLPVVIYQWLSRGWKRWSKRHLLKNMRVSNRNIAFRSRLQPVLTDLSHRRFISSKRFRAVPLSILFLRVPVL